MILIPSKYTGEGAGISARFMGLNKDDYEELSIAIDDGEFKEVERDPNILFMSTSAEFGGLVLNEIHKVRGKIIQNGVEDYAVCYMPAKRAFVETRKTNVMRGGAFFRNEEVGGK